MKIKSNTLLSTTVVAAFLALFQLSASRADDASPLKPVGLRCEYLQNPIGIDEVHPRLSWRLESEQRGQSQSAFRIVVAATAEELAKDVGSRWDSGKVQSDQTLHIPYAGNDLKTGQTCFWKVRTWDKDDRPSAWSASASWSMGLLEETDWTASYISYKDTSPVFKDRKSLYLPAARQYRKQFNAGQPDRKVRRATLYATALGIYELEINGRRVSDHYFAPGWTDYRQRAYYNSYDVTDMIASGDNAIGATVADGWYSGYCAFGLLVGIGTEQIGRYSYGKTPALMAQLEIEYEDGSRQTIGTDKSWKVTGEGPHREADFLMGQFYDATREMPGWSTADFDDRQWESAIFASENGSQMADFYQFDVSPGDAHPRIKGKPIDLGFIKPKLEAFPGVPVRVTQELKTKTIDKRESGEHILDFGQNFAGTIRLKVTGPAGHKIKIRYGEMLHPDGRLMTENLRKARSTDFYVCKGDPGGEVFSPQFTSHGFQYVELSNFSEAPTLDSVTGLVLHSDTPMTSSFACSDPMVNQLFSNVLWTQRANFIDLPTDCPQRDERMGWTGDAQAYIATAAYNADIGAFFTKWNRELMESQRPSGAFPGYAPYPFQHGHDFGTAWADAGVICPWTIWQVYGDTRMIDACWEPMTRFLDWRKRTSVGDLGIAHGNGWGDWLNQGEDTPLEYIDSVYFAISTRMMAEMAQATGRIEEAAAFQQQLGRTKATFVKKYVNDDGSINVKTQTAHALAIYADLVPADKRIGTGEKLAAMLKTNGNHMATGFLGTKPLLPVLSEVGQHDLATFLLQSREFPSWGYEVEQGATSIWERWDGFTKEDGFGRHNAAMNSYSHYAFGAVCEWMFRSLAGIAADEPGYKTIVIRPLPPRPGSNAQHAPIDWVKASYDSIRGTIKSDWKLDGDTFRLNVSIPANTTASVYLPTSDLAKVLESGKPIQGHAHIKHFRSEPSHIVLEVQSGDYEFSAPSNLKPADVALATSAPVDNSMNPEEIDVTNAKQLAHWDFSNADDVKHWGQLNNLEIQRRDAGTFLVATGNDPQMMAKLPKPIAGKLAVKLRLRPKKGTDCQLFWARPSKGFNAAMQVKRRLKPADGVNEYLFSIDADQPIGGLRFDPFQTFETHANRGEMLIESITIYRLAMAAVQPQSQTTPAAGRPNVMFILTEDQGAHLSLLNTPGLQTPNLDSIAREGVYFKNAFVAYSVCSPSKAAIYTGLYCHTNGILNNTLNYHKPAYALTLNEKNNTLYKRNRIKPKYMTLIELLRENGYYQGVTHKLHVAPVEKFPYDEFVTGSRGELDQFLKNANAGNRPWFLMVNIPYSHRPYPNSDKVKIRVRPDQVELPPYLPDVPMIRQDWAEYLAGIEKADQVAGQAIDALKASGQYDNTIIIYMSDHGPTYPHGKMTLHDLGLRVPLAISGPGVEKNRTRDDLVSEIDLLPTVMDLIADVSGEPLVLPADKQRPGTTNRLNYDLHGQSIYSLLTDPLAVGKRKYIFGEVSARGPIPNKGLQERSVTDGRWKLIYREKVQTRWRQVNDDSRMLKTWGNRTYAETIRLKDKFPEAYRVLREMDPQNLNGQIPKLELYDWKSDPHEMNNLTGQKKFQQHQRRLLDQLRQWKLRTKDQSIKLSAR